jgi:hypothetical protein
MEDGKSAGIGLPAKSRAPALVAGWAPRISQTPRFGARLFLFPHERIRYCPRDVGSQSSLSRLQSFLFSKGRIHNKFIEITET